MEQNSPLPMSRASPTRWCVFFYPLMAVDLITDMHQIIDLGYTISSLCRVIPDGVVAFFPSYDYLNHVLSTWKKKPDRNETTTIFDLIHQTKPILYGGTGETENILQEYTTTITQGKGKGALLLSVVGGKLSEGINFSDKLGRAVLIIGLPFPNINTAVWQSKIRYIEDKTCTTTKSEESNNNNNNNNNKKAAAAAAKEAGRSFYENACMRAVNQSIGRAIRHRNDYAAIVMIDKRYDSARIQAKLPDWIRQAVSSSSSSSSAVHVVQEALFRFFAGRSEESSA